MKKKLINSKNCIRLLMVAQLSLALITMHDVATAQGIGLYMASQWGSADRLPFDILADACGMTTLLLVLVLPYLLLTHRSVEAFFRFTTVYFAFMPTLSMAMLIHLFDGHNLMMLQFDWERNLTLLSTFVREVIPVLIILYCFYRKGGFTIKSWHKVMLLVEAILCLGMLLLPELSDVFLHSMYYLLAIIAFDWWENLRTEKAELYEKVLAWLIFGALYCRGCFRMVELLSKYHL